MDPVVRDFKLTSITSKSYPSLLEVTRSLKFLYRYACFIDAVLQPGPPSFSPLLDFLSMMKYTDNRF